MCPSNIWTHCIYITNLLLNNLMSGLPPPRKKDCVCPCFVFVLSLPRTLAACPSGNLRNWFQLYNRPVLPTARKFGQITQNSPNFKPRGREKFGPNFWPNFLFSQILAENSPNYQSSVLISIISTQGWPNLSNWVNVWLKTINGSVVSST